MLHQKEMRMYSVDVLPPDSLKPTGPLTTEFTSRGIIDFRAARSGVEPAETISQFLHEETIDPEQIGDYKVRLHRKFMLDWVNDNADAVKELSLVDVWRIREECIAALTQ